LLILNW